jgi:hypothetical protein
MDTSENNLGMTSLTNQALMLSDTSENNSGVISLTNQTFYILRKTNLLLHSLDC